MKMTLEEALTAISKGFLPDEYKKKTLRLRRLSNEKYDLEDSIDVLEGSAEEKHIEKLDKKKKRLQKVIGEIDVLLSELGGKA